VTGLIYCRGKLAHLPPKPDDIPATPENAYKDDGWVNLGEWLGTGVIAPRFRKYLSFKLARTAVRRLGIKTQKEWRAFAAGRLPHLGILPKDIPATPWMTYKDDGWLGVGDWLGTEMSHTRLHAFCQSPRIYRETKAEIRQRVEFVHFGQAPKARDRRQTTSLRTCQRVFPKTRGWKGLGEWLGNRQGCRSA
jgi:hypothetical protein